MHSLTFQNDNSPFVGQVITNYQSLPRRSCKLSNIREAVKAWNKATPGDAQNYISQLVAKEWFARGGKGLLLAGSEHNTKQNFFRMINNPSPKNDKSLTALLPVIIDVMGKHNETISRQFGLVTGKTKDELVASAIKEDGEALQAVLLNLDARIQVKELLESISANAAMLPSDLSVPITTMVTNMLGAI